MKKIFKSRVFAFILGALIFGSIGVVSAYTIFANDIGYTPKDSTWKKSNGEDITNVKDAIDELYNKASTSYKTFTLVEDNFQLNTANQTVYSNYVKEVDVSNFKDYNDFTENDFYIVINSIAPAGGSGTSSTAFVDFTKSYDSSTGILTITAPYEVYSGVGVWLNISVYLYY